MKKICSLFVSLFVILAVVLPINIGINNAKAEEAATPIDMYLIAGQSNALGSSLHYGNLTETYTNIGYAGEGDRLYSTGVARGDSNVSSFDRFKWEVKAGYGCYSSQVGPEYGMAQVFNELYASTEKAFIFKSAAGGTALQNVQHDCGNWYPRSLWPEGYDPADRTDPMGFQYYSFVERFEFVYNELKDNGYAPKVKGMVWMQGENDLGAHDIYESLIKTFITDIRKDLVDITDDETLSQMPFVMGKIATSFGSYNNSSVPSFNEMQDRVAAAMINVATVETSDLIIVNQDGSINGSDKWHFNWEDAEILGVRFGKKLLEYADLSYVTTVAHKGEISYVYDEDNNLIFELTPDRNCKLQSIMINEKDLTSQVVDGKLTLEDPTDIVKVVATFVELKKYNFTYDDLSEYGGSFINKAFYCFEGNTLRVKVKLPEGYEILSVKLNDIDLTLNTESGYYEIVPTANGHITVEVKEPIVEDSQTNNSTTDNQTSEGESGCGSTIGLGISAILPLIGMAVIVLKKKK